VELAGRKRVPFGSGHPGQRGLMNNAPTLLGIFIK
jgi:hypothetical protein